MAFYDNKYWILSHIRNSFLYSDDTGRCFKLFLETKHQPNFIVLYPL